MSLEGTVQNGVIVLDPGSPPLADGTRVEIAPRTGMEPHINKTPGVCGGSACIGRRRIAVWMLVESRRAGVAEDTIRADYDPPLTQAEFDAAMEYARRNPREMDQELWFNDDAFNIPDPSDPPLWVLARGRALGIPDREIADTFDPPFDPTRIEAAWAAYQADPGLLDRRDR